MRIFSFFVIVCLLLCLGIYEANAHREHKAHTHGKATMDISIEKNEIEVDLDIPGADLVGFEGKAKTQEQKDNLKSVTNLLTKDYALLTIPESAGCVVTKRKLESDHDDHGKDHTSYEYEVKYKCKNTSKVTEFDFNLFRDIQSLSEVAVQVVTESTQKSFVLKSTETKINLK